MHKSSACKMLVKSSTSLRHRGFSTFCTYKFTSLSKNIKNYENFITVKINVKIIITFSRFIIIHVDFYFHKLRKKQAFLLSTFFPIFNYMAISVNICCKVEYVYCHFFFNFPQVKKSWMVIYSRNIAPFFT